MNVACQSLPRIGEMYTVQPLAVPLSITPVEVDFVQESWKYRRGSNYNVFPGEDWLLLIAFWEESTIAHYIFLFNGSTWLYAWHESLGKKPFFEVFYTLEVWNERCLPVLAINR